MSIINIDPSGVRMNLQSLMNQAKKEVNQKIEGEKKQNPFRFTTESSLEAFNKTRNSDANSNKTLKAKNRETQSENWLG